MKTNRNVCIMAAWLLMAAGGSVPVSASNNYLADYAVDTIAGSNTLDYRVMVIYSDGTSSDVTDSATVDYSAAGLCSAASGVITGKDYGDVTLTFGYKGVTDELPLIVQNVTAARSVASIAFTPETISLPLNGRTTFTANAVYKDGHTEDITTAAKFYSSNSNIIRVNADSVIAVACGTAKVKVLYRGLLGSTVIGLLPVTVNYNDPYTKTEAESFSSQSGVECETLTGTDKNVAFIENSDWVQYDGMDFGSNGASSFTITAATPVSGGSVKVYVGSNLVGTCTIGNTGSWTTWKSFTCKINGATGAKSLRLVFSGGSGYLFNINSWFFTEATTGVDDVPAETGNVNVYTTNGIMVRRNISRDNWKQGLKQGLYIVGDKKESTE